MKPLPRFLSFIGFLLLSVNTAWAQSKPGLECHAQPSINEVRIEMCLAQSGPFQHDIYVLRLNGVTVFAIADDYVEQIELQHTIPEAAAIEFPLSSQGEKTVKISGGCLPESKDNTEVARVCNFQWGKYSVVKNQRFDFK